MKKILLLATAVLTARGPLWAAAIPTGPLIITNQQQQPATKSETKTAALAALLASVKGTDLARCDADAIHVFSQFAPANSRRRPDNIVGCSFLYDISPIIAEEQLKDSPFDILIVPKEVLPNGNRLVYKPYAQGARTVEDLDKIGASVTKAEIGAAIDEARRILERKVVADFQKSIAPVENKPGIWSRLVDNLKKSDDDGSVVGFGGAKTEKSEPLTSF